MPKPEFIYISYIETTPEKLWEALTSSEFTRLYWWNTSVVSDWTVGSPFSLVLNGKTTDVGEILAVRGIVDELESELGSRVRVQVGAMIETPAPLSWHPNSSAR